MLTKYCSDNVIDIYNSKGPFEVKKYEIKETANLESRPFEKIGDNEYYLGQVDKNTGFKEGRGVLIKEGSLYEGFWKRGKEMGVGRFIN